MANAWWRTHRPAAREALRDELRAARQLLAGNPKAGRVAADGDDTVRRLLLPTVHYLVFYRVDDEARAVQIVALRYSSREEAEG